GDIYFDLGSSLTRLAQYDEAAAAFQKCLDIDPENYRAQDALDEAREGVKRIKTARKYQEEQLKKEEEKKKKEGQTEPGATPVKTPSRIYESFMATDRPPPYFPQGTLSPPDEGRYRR